MSRQRRNVNDIFKWAAFLKKKEQEESIRTAQQILRVARVAAVFMVIINSILAIDVYLLPPTVKNDKLDEISSYTTYSRRGGSTRHYEMRTVSGFTCEVRHSTGFNLHNAIMLIKQTPLFRMTYEFYLPEHNIFIERSYNIYSISFYSCIVLLLLGAVSIYKRILHDDNYTPLAIFICILMVTQCVLLLI